jgi:predicted glycosyl hydrolase (DUF1957 family)
MIPRGKPPVGYITVNEAVKRSGYSRQMIYNLIRSETLKVSRKSWEFWVNVKSLASYAKSRGRLLTE